MEPIQDRLQRLREERIAREKARIDKLKELNLKKYGKDTTGGPTPCKTLPQTKTQSKSDMIQKNIQRSFLRPSTAPVQLNSSVKNQINKSVSTVKNQIPKLANTIKNVNSAPANSFASKREHANDKKNVIYKCESKLPMKINKIDSATNRSLPSKKIDVKQNLTRKSMAPPSKSKPTEVTLNAEGKRESVFDRLYKPKLPQKTSNTDKEKNDLSHLKKSKVPVTTNIIKKRHTVFETKVNSKVEHSMRRSISAIHLKKMDKRELQKCIHKWSSIGEKLNKVHLTEVDEDSTIEKINISAVKSDRRKSVKRGVSFNLNAPTGDELQTRLKSWLQRRGKSLDSYHHLQCFGIHHIAQTEKEVLNFQPYDEENKENIDQPEGDDNSYTDNLDDRKNDFNKWRNRMSCVSDIVDLNTSKDTSVISEASPVHTEQELILGALNDLSELLREGYEWEQCARWLRALREMFPGTQNLAAYWECRAALEESQGNFPASVECWEEAIAKGTERSVVEASLDQLLDKFMQLKISPNAGRKMDTNQKLVDVKNVFKSTLIRFAVQTAKLKQMDNVVKYVATPVRRSSRLSLASQVNNKQPTPHSMRKRTPLVQLCSSMRQIDEEVRANLVFVPNKTLEFTP